MQHYVLGDVITEISERENNPSNSEYERFVGLEHYVSGEVEIENYGSTANLNSAMKVFNSGDILVARRNVYLKRASVVYFDGLTSGDSIVLRPKNETIGRILPFILNTDDFWDYADQYSDGTMSKRLSPKVLKQYEFDLPDDNLEQLADILWAMVDVKKSYQRLLKQTDELVKSQFIEMFGYENDGMKTIDDIANICRGASPRPISKFVTDDEDGVNWIKIGDVTEEDIYITHTAEKITKEGAKKSRPVEPGDFILSNSMSFGRPYILGIHGCVHDGWLIISDYQNHLDPLFFYYELRSDLVQRQFDGSANGSCVKNLNSDLVKKVKIHIPPMDKQKEFVEFAQQSDKSKFELKQAIEGVDILIKSMIQQELN